jgi:SAM-dependent methyltransferase
MEPGVNNLCTVCGRENRPDAIFCDRCTYPLKVANLAGLTRDEKRVCLSKLFYELAEATARPDTHLALDEDLWLAYLSAFWLRPETAIIEYREAMAIRSAGASGPWLDLGCGDGIHAALYSGFSFEEGFDAFAGLDLSSSDFYNRFDPASFQVKHSRTGRPIDVGLDIKPTAIERARALEVFERAEVADATRLPLADRSVATIFSNMLRDLGEVLDAALAECFRVLRDDGQLLLSTMTPAYAGSLVFAPAAREAEARGDRAMAEQLLRLDRGRSVFCRQQLSTDQWNEKLAKHGLHVERTHTIITQEITRLWDVGLRPFSHDLLTWRQRIDHDSLLAVKRAALPMLDHVLRPIVARAEVGEPCMQLLVVRKGWT